MKLLKCEHCGDMVEILYKAGNWYCAHCYIGMIGNVPEIKRAVDV